MEDMKSLFKGKDHAAVYKTYRPGMELSVVHKIIDFLAVKFNPSECDAADVGCGSGQGTIPLAPFLRHIVGLDPSEAQIAQIKDEGKLPENVEFRIGEAEHLPFHDCSLQLITVKNALHWFDMFKFYEEVDRVLQPGGVLAVYVGSGLHEILGHEREVEELFDSIAKDYRSPEWEKKANTKFKDIKFPYKECIRSEEFAVESKVSVRHLINLGRTKSDVANFMRKNPDAAEAALKQAEEKMMKIVGSTGTPEETFVVQRNNPLLVLCRKPECPD